MIFFDNFVHGMYKSILYVCCISIVECFVVYAYIAGCLYHFCMHYKQTGDLHPGNILVRFDPRTGEPHYVFLDCGIVFSSRTEEDHKLLVDICLAFMKHDGILAG